MYVFLVITLHVDPYYFHIDHIRNVSNDEIYTGFETIAFNQCEKSCLCCPQFTNFLEDTYWFIK